MYIPAELKADPRWKSLTPKARTNVGKLIQPFRHGQLLEYGASYNGRKKGLLENLTFSFYEKGEQQGAGGRRQEPGTYLTIILHIFAIFDGRQPTLKMETISIRGDTDLRGIFSNPTKSPYHAPHFKVLQDPD